jgi:hypothetical protein
MQWAQRMANGRNSGYSGTRQAQTEASANPSDRLDTARKNDKRQQPTQTQPTRTQTANNGGVNPTRGPPNPKPPQERQNQRPRRRNGAAEGSGNDDGCEKRQLAMAKTWQER